MSGLRAFEAERLRVSQNIVARGRHLGAYMEAQLKSDEERRRAEQIRVPERVMMETAAPWDYGQRSVSLTGYPRRRLEDG